MQKLIIFGSPHCVNCIKLKKLLEDKKSSYEYYDVTKPDGYSKLAFYRLASEKAIPIIVDSKGKKLDFDLTIKEIEKLENIIG